MEEDVDVRERGGHEGERRSPLETRGAGERRKQEKTALPGGAELRHRELPPGSGETQQNQSKDRAGEDGGRENAGAGHILGRMWTEQVQGIY
ncbi:hypothetical protein NDU88_004552 [Pleurodeles waltl]|uniref:Uncharacterized protein n=1 Tax=Pleurodeles waltl TaxID=8319 RepID=A0AAV7PCW5_PLEWA|nr:hypothetical protein NDU88_004552 [Pleurodeles waltl]